MFEEEQPEAHFLKTHKLELKIIIYIPSILKNEKDVVFD